MMYDRTWKAILARLAKAEGHKNIGGEWKDKRWMNTPGPIYTGGADFVFLGPDKCPTSIAADDEGIDVIFRQPSSVKEAEQLIVAAKIDPFGGYALDGNRNWTIRSVRSWWKQREKIRKHISNMLQGRYWYKADSLTRRLATNWRRFLDFEAEAYLQRYCYFLKNGRWPSPKDQLPRL